MWIRFVCDLLRCFWGFFFLSSKQAHHCWAYLLCCETAWQKLTPAVTHDAVEECPFEDILCSLISSFSTEFICEVWGEKGSKRKFWEMVQLLFVWALQVWGFTCVFVPALADSRCGVLRGTVTPGKEEGCTFNCEEALTDTGREEKMKHE